MAIDFYELTCTKVPYNSLIDIVKEKTTLKSKDIILFFDVLIFFLRKRIVEKGTLRIKRFGTIRVKQLKREKRIDFFNSSNIALKIINGNLPNVCPNERYLYCQDFYSAIFTKISKCTSLKANSISILFNFFIYGLIRELIDRKTVTVRNFGVFYIREYNYQKWGNKVCGRECTITNTKRIMFRAKRRFTRELNGLEKEIEAFERTKRVLRLSHMENELFIKNDEIKV
jgi:nucleoid DNA-binding protein